MTVCREHEKRLLTVFILSPVSPRLSTKQDPAGQREKPLNMMLYFFSLILFSQLECGRSYNREEVETRLPVIYPSYLYLTVPPRKVNTEDRGVKIIMSVC